MKIKQLFQKFQEQLEIQLKILYLLMDSVFVLVLLLELENLKKQYSDVNNLKEVTIKSSVYCEINYNEKLKKGLLDIENLNKNESKKLVGRKINDNIKINIKKLANNNKEALSDSLKIFLKSLAHE